MPDSPKKLTKFTHRLRLPNFSLQPQETGQATAQANVPRRTKSATDFSRTMTTEPHALPRPDEDSSKVREKSRNSLQEPLSKFSSFSSKLPGQRSGDTSTNSSGTRRLRRSVHKFDLRNSVISAAPTAQMDVGNSVIFVSSGSSNEALSPVQRLPETVVEPQRRVRESVPAAIRVPSSSSGSSPVHLVHLDVERIVRWRRTATTLENGMAGSPVTLDTNIRIKRPKITRKGEGKCTMEAVTQDDVQGHSSGNASVNADEASEKSAIDGHAYAPVATSQHTQKISLPDRDTTNGIDETGSNNLPQFLTLHVLPQAQAAGNTFKVLEAPKKPIPSRSLLRLPRPSPLLFSPAATHPLHLAASRDDSQTYSIEGLTLVMAKFYAPGFIPSPVKNALPSPIDMAALSDKRTPTGAYFQHQSELGAGHIERMETKERNYVAYFIDTLLWKLKIADREIERLEGVADDKEMEKAEMQWSINQLYHQSQIIGKRSDQLDRLVQEIVKVVPRESLDSSEAFKLAKELGIELEQLVVVPKTDIDSFDEDENMRSNFKDCRELEQQLKKAKEEVKYWKARAEAAERYVVAMDGDVSSNRSHLTV